MLIALKMLQSNAIYNPKRDDEHPHHFHMGVPPPRAKTIRQSAVTSCTWFSWTCNASLVLSRLSKKSSRFRCRCKGKETFIFVENLDISVLSSLNYIRTLMCVCKMCGLLKRERNLILHVKHVSCLRLIKSSSLDKSLVMSLLTFVSYLTAQN